LAIGELLVDLKMPGTGKPGDVDGRCIDAYAHAHAFKGALLVRAESPFAHVGAGVGGASDARLQAFFCYLYA